MHARHRSGVGNGYMPNAMGMGDVSRILPDGSSMRGHGFHNLEYRNFNSGGFGRGQGRQFQPPPLQPSRKDDVFMEAGKLAAAYLVSNGLLPPNALSRKWQNCNVKNPLGDFQSVRSQDGDSLPLFADSRTSALHRLGNAAADIGPSRTTSFDDCNSIGSEKFMGGGKSSGSFENYNSEWNRELGRSDCGLQNFHWSEERPRSETPGDAETALERNKSIDDAIKVSVPSHTKKKLNPGADVEPTHESVDVKMSDAESEEVKDENNNGEVEKQSIKEDIAVEPLVEEDNQDPTKTRSSFTAKSAKFDQDPVSKGNDTCEIELPKGSETEPENVHVDGSFISDSSTPSLNLKIVDSDVKKLSAVEEEQGFAYTNGEGNCLNPMTLQEKSLVQEQERNDGLSSFGSSSSLYMERGEKRALDVEDCWDATKKSREWSPSIDTRSIVEKPQISEEAMTSNFGDRPDQKKLLDGSLFPEGDVACVDYTEKKKFFPTYFKTCDLNFLEASEVNESQYARPIRIDTSITECGKQAIPVNIDLNLTNKGNVAHKNGACASHGKDVEVIILENDSIQENKGFDGSERRVESVLNGMDGFHDNAISDSQDGYRLMISELLGNDIPNGFSEPPIMNSLHNDMCLRNGEGILSGDDLIYMALGEIPTSFFRAWEQPTQEFGKPL